MQTCRVYHCSKCSLQYFDKDVNIDTDYLKKYSQSRNKNSVLNKLRQKQYRIDIQHLTKNIHKGNLLDVGCSTGDFLNNLSKKTNLKLYGIDIDKDAIHIAKNKNNKKINFINTDIINFQTNLKFDCIVFRGSFQFLGHDLKKSFKKISKISSKKCKIIIYSLPNSDSILYYLLKDIWHLFDKFHQTLIFNKESIIKLSQIYNYEIIECSYPYLETPYANRIKNYEDLIELIKDNKQNSFPFWGNIMQIVLQNK